MYTDVLTKKQKNLIFLISSSPNIIVLKRGGRETIKILIKNVSYLGAVIYNNLFVIPTYFFFFSHQLENNFKGSWLFLCCFLRVVLGFNLDTVLIVAEIWGKKYIKKNNTSNDCFSRGRDFVGWKTVGPKFLASGGWWVEKNL